MMTSASTTTTTGTLWNGPICPTCGARYLGSHTCSREDITRRITELLALLGTLPVATRPQAGTSGCPCRPENGGSGVCGCVLGGPTITCSSMGDRDDEPNSAHQRATRVNFECAPEDVDAIAQAVTRAGKAGRAAGRRRK